MKFKEYKKKKFNYDGNKIIKVGAEELYPFVYKRLWDLTQYDTKVLESYGLSKALYVYIGSSSKTNLRKRNRDWKYEIVNDGKSVSKRIKDFIRKLKKFYEEETDYTRQEINEMLYHSSEIMTRCESLQGPRTVEK